MTAFLFVVALIIAYLLGSLPTAYIIARLRKGTDIREVGSHNMGAMNVFYNIGFWWGLLVLLADIGKGAAAVAIAWGMQIGDVAIYLSGVAVVLGHAFPVFLRFRGGKGGATCIGVLCFLMPWGIPIACGVFALLLLVTRFPTLSYSIALVTFPFVGGLIYDSWQLVVYSLGLLLIPFVRYIPRIKEMRGKAGGWGHFFRRKGLSDRF